MTKQNGVDVWPNAAIWMWDELRSKVRTVLGTPVESSTNKLVWYSVFYSSALYLNI